MEILISQNPQQCQLFGKLGWLVQGLLGAVSFSSLIVKRYTDQNRRTWKIWFMDTSKQGFSAGLLHILNLLISYYIEGKEPGSGQCTWYFLTFVVDIFLGMAIAYILLNSLEKCLNGSETLRFKSGFYGEPPSWGYWAYQMWLWLGIILFTKFSLIGIMIVFKGPLRFIGDLLLKPIERFPNFELIMVMIIIPVVMNSLMFWITDSFLKNGEKVVIATETISIELLEKDIDTEESVAINKYQI